MTDSADVATQYMFKYTTVSSVEAVSPSAVFAEGGSVLSVMTVGVQAGTSVECRFGATVSVVSSSVAGGVVECMSVAQIAGNTTVQVSVNGQDWSTAGAGMVQVVSGMNVSSVEPALVSVNGGSELLIGGSGFQIEGVYCGIGGATWSSTVASVVSSTQASCVVAARGAGMHVLEVSLGAGGVMSYSGVQVEYAAMGHVTSVTPSIGSVSGGTVVTLAGEGFVAGRTACRFGSAAGVVAEVLSSTEARCTTVAGVMGMVPVSISTSWDDESSSEGVWSESGIEYKSVSVVSLRQVVPSVVDQAGGTSVSVVSGASVEREWH